MTNNLTAIKNAVVAKLQGLNKVKYVYAYEKGDLAGFPAVTVYTAEYIAEWSDTTHDWVTYIFTLHLYQELKNKTPADAESIVDNALTDIIQAFENDWTLGGLVHKTGIKAIKGWTAREITDRVGVITLTCQKLEAI